MFERSIGIDISKNWFDIHLNEKVHRVLQKDMTSFIKSHKDDLRTSLCVMGSTGGYEMALAQALTHQGIAVHIAHPNQVAAFMRARNRVAKTDAIDARLLSAFGAFLKPDQIRRPPSPSHVRLAHLGAHMSQLKDMIHQEHGRSGHPNKADPFLTRSSKRIMSSLEKELEACEKERMTLINGSLVLKRLFDILISMPGIGSCSALSILADLREIGHLSKKEIAALLGVAPLTKESGLRRRASSDSVWTSRGS